MPDMTTESSQVNEDDGEQDGIEQGEVQEFLVEEVSIDGMCGVY